MSAVIDLLGVLAYAKLGSFERLSLDSSLAPTVADRVTLGRMATVEFNNYEQIALHLTQLGSDPLAAMNPFVEVFDRFNETLTPSDWYEGLVKTYVGDGIIADFYRAVSEYLDPQTAALIESVCADYGHNDYAVTQIRSKIEDDHKVGGRLALWGRRLMGEMISHANVVIGGQPRIADEFRTLTKGDFASELGTLVNRLTVGHTRRMDALGLAS